MKKIIFIFVLFLLTSSIVYAEMDFALKDATDVNSAIVKSDASSVAGSREVPAGIKPIESDTGNIKPGTDIEIPGQDVSDSIANISDNKSAKYRKARNVLHAVKNYKAVRKKLNIRNVTGKYRNSKIMQNNRSMISAEILAVINESLRDKNNYSSAGGYGVHKVTKRNITEENRSLAGRIIEKLENILPKNNSNIVRFGYRRELVRKQKPYVVIMETKPLCYINVSFKEIKNIKTEKRVFRIAKISRENITKLLSSDCVIKVSDKKGLKTFIKYAKERIRNETKIRISKMKLNKTTKDALYEHIEKIAKNLTVQKDKVSPLQSFVTPNNSDIVKLSDGLTIEQIYKKASDWVWMSDMTLNKVPEKWLYPEEFLVKTPYMDTNPLSVSVSDCEEQANTLASMLRTILPAEKVRVALGEVDFGSGPTGHAWVEILEDDGWVVLDPTNGPFYDDEEKKLITRDELPFDYWKYHEYPVVKVWAYYNDKYYNGNLIGATGTVNNAPQNWNVSYKQLFDEDVNKTFMEAAVVPMVNWTILAIVFILGFVFFIFIVIARAAQRNL